MSDEIRTIDREELKAKLDRGDDLKLIMAMHEWGFRAAHIPGSVHYATVAAADENLNRNDEIVVYCTDPGCVASQVACKWLVDASEVLVFADACIVNRRRSPRIIAGSNGVRSRGFL